MSLDNIKDGSLCVLDTNVLLYAEQGTSQEAQRLLHRIGNGDLSGILPQPVWQELSHKLMLAEAIMLKHIKGRNMAHQLATKPHIIRGLRLYKEKMKALFTLGLKFEACMPGDLIETAFDLQTRHGLMTNDSVILAVAIRIQANALVSADHCFRSIKEVAVFSPSDISLTISSP
jgi:predicted nucleic acid-binding protein